MVRVEVNMKLIKMIVAAVIALTMVGAAVATPLQSGSHFSHVAKEKKGDGDIIGG
jgi:hypothetical protein